MPAHVCSQCGREDKCYERGVCDRCVLVRRTAELLAGPDGTVPLALVGIHDAIIASQIPRKALNWVRKGAGAPILAAMAAGAMPLTHEALDAHPRPRAANYVRHMLVANGALLDRDDDLATLERHNAKTVAAIDRAEDRSVVAAFATWHVLRRLRRQAERNSGGRTSIRHARNQVVGAVRFLDGLAACDLDLGTCTQGDLDRWLATGPSSRYDARAFIDWSSKRRLSTRLVVPPLKSRPGDALDPERRWALVHQFLTDPGIDLADRVAGCFLLLYAQPLSRIVAMTLDQITVAAAGVSIRFANTSHDLAVPDPLATLVAKQVKTGRSRNIGLGAVPTSWLFPGHLPGRPITASRLGERLGTFGIDARAARRAAQQQLAAEVPAVVLAELLGIAIQTAVRWVHAAGGDWANYAGLVAGDGAQY
jgi:hypothetical protein